MACPTFPRFLRKVAHADADTTLSFSFGGVVIPARCGNLSVTAAVSNQLQGGYSYDAAGSMMRDNNGTNYT